jgi:leader peptidase (prepilin peptidase)/N-methyltransferase
MDWLPVITTFIIGSCVGSFLNVLIYRLPREESIWSPRSHCPHCNKTIPWYRNIPLVSFFIQNGKCAECDASISWQYPTVEVITGYIWATCFFVFNPLHATMTALFSSILIALAWIDLKTMMIPLSLIISGAIVIGLSIITGILEWKLVLWGSLAGMAIPLIMMGLTFLITRRQGMGWGDIQLGLILGAWLGPWFMMIALFLAALFGILAWISISIINGFDRNRPLPFAPYLVVSTMALLFCESWVVLWFDKFLLL